MKKLLSILLFLVLLVSPMMSAAANETTYTTLYIDIGPVIDSEKTVSGVWLWCNDGTEAFVSNQQMTPVSGTIYSYSVPAQAENGSFSVFDADNVRIFYGQFFDADLTVHNLYTPGGDNYGTWSSYYPERGKDVTAGFTPEIALSGAAFSGDAVTFDAESGEYIFTIPVDGAAGTQPVLTLTGTNLRYAAAADEIKLRSLVTGNGEELLTETSLPELAETLTYQDGSLSLEVNLEQVDGIRYEVIFSNDGGTTWEAPITLVYKQAYAITNNTNDTNGTVSVAQTAFAGQTIPITVTPNDGYRLAMIHVTYVDAEGATRSVAVIGNTFTMPAFSVVLDATFEEAPRSYDVTLGTVEYGSVTADHTQATPGTTVTLTVTPDAGYRLSSLTVNDGAVQVAKVDDTTYTFAMPEGAATVSVYFERVLYTITIEASENGTVMAAPLNAAGQWDIVRLTWSADTGYELFDLYVLDAEGYAVEFIEAGIDYATFVMPAASVTVYSEFSAIPIVSADIVWGSLSFVYTEGEDGAEGSWSCEEDANKITVTNTGNIGFTIEAEYKAKEGYEEISGVLLESETAKEVDAIEADVGTTVAIELQLSGAPAKVLDGAVIGSVTITLMRGMIT